MSSEDKKELKVFSLAEVEEHTKRDSCWFVIGAKVYDVSKFLDEHPGGEEVLLEQAGKDATENFEDVGHSSEAQEMMAEYMIGELNKDDCKKVKELRSKIWNSYDSSEDGSNWASWIIPMGVALAVSIMYKMYLSS